MPESSGNRPTNHHAELRSWQGGDIGNGFRLEGNIYLDKMTGGHHPFPDGDHVHTSPVKWIEICDDAQKVAVTQSGTRYLLK